MIKQLLNDRKSQKFILSAALGLHQIPAENPFRKQSLQVPSYERILPGKNASASVHQLVGMDPEEIADRDVYRRCPFYPV